MNKSHDDSLFSVIEFQVAMLDIRTLSVLFITDSVSDPNSPIISLAVKSFLDTSSLIDSPKDSDSNTLNDPKKGLMFYMTKDAHIVVCDSSSGHFLTSQSIQPKDSTAISMYIIGKYFSWKIENFPIIFLSYRFMILLSLQRMAICSLKSLVKSHHQAQLKTVKLKMNLNKLIPMMEIFRL